MLEEERAHADRQVREEGDAVAGAGERGGAQCMNLRQEAHSGGARGRLQLFEQAQHCGVVVVAGAEVCARLAGEQLGGPGEGDVDGAGVDEGDLVFEAGARGEEVLVHVAAEGDVGCCEGEEDGGRDGEEELEDCDGGFEGGDEGEVGLGFCVLLEKGGFVGSR